MATVPYTFTDGTGNVIYATQVNENFDSLMDAINAGALSSTDATLTSLYMIGYGGGVAVRGISGDTTLGTSNSTLPTQLAVKTYVDSQISGENLWDRTSPYLVPHNVGDSLNLTGDATIGDLNATRNLRVANDVYVTRDATAQDLRATRNLRVASGAAINNIDTNVSLGTSDTAVPTQLAVKTYVDAQVSGSNVWDKTSGTLTQLITRNERVYIGSDTSRIDMTANAGIDVYTPGILRVNADTTFSGNIVSRGFQLVEGDSYQQVVVKSTSATGGLLLQVTGANASVTVNAADAGGSVVLTRYGSQGGLTVGSDATTRFSDAVQMRGPYTSVGADGTDLVVANVSLQVVGSEYILQDANDAGLTVRQNGAGPIATFHGPADQAIFQADATAVRVNADATFTGNIVSRGFQLLEGDSYQQVILKSTSATGGIRLQATGSNASVSINAEDAGGSVSITRAGFQGGVTVGNDATILTYDALRIDSNAILNGTARFAEGGSSGSPLAIPMDGYNNIQIQPTTNSYYLLGAACQAGHIVAVTNESALTPYVAGTSIFHGYIQVSPWTTVLVVSDSSGNWSPVRPGT